MIEYLYDAIKATAGQDFAVNAWITDENENVITENCCLGLHHPDGTMIAKVNGVFLPESLMWEFTVPADVTAGLQGRHWYCIMHADSNMCFKQPIYLV